MSKIVIDPQDVEKLSSNSQRVMHILLEELDEVKKLKPKVEQVPRIKKLFCQIRKNTVFSKNDSMRLEIFRHAINDIINKNNEVIDRLHKLEDEVEDLGKEKRNDDE